MSNVYIQSMGHYHPENELGNDFIDSLDIGSNAQWGQERTGIEARRSVLDTEDIIAIKEGRETLDSVRKKGRVPTIASIAKPAWGMLTERLGQAADPDLLICGTSVPDYDIPANGCTIAAELDMSCAAFDANSACSSFIVNLHLARSLIASKQHKNVAVFNPERYSLRIDFNDRNSCVLFGDGSSAAYVSETSRPGALRVIDTVVASDPKGFDLVKIPDGEYFTQNGKAVQKFAITRTIEVTKALLDRNRLSPEGISYFTGHQANLRMVLSASERLGFAPEKHLYNVDKFGNQGAAGAPAVLSMNWDRFQSGDKIVVAVVGSGLTWGAALLERV